MKKLTVLCLLSALLLCSCGTTTTEVAVVEQEEAPAVEEAVLTAADAAYDELTQTVANTLVDGWQNPTTETLGISDIYSTYPDSVYSFVKTDINNDGIPELLFTEMMDTDDWASPIYDAWTWDAEAGEMIHFFTGGERHNLYVNLDNRINEIGSSGADDSIDAWHTLNSDGSFSDAEAPEGDDLFLQCFADMTPFVMLID